MIFKLITKDLRVYQETTFLRILILCLFISTIFILRYYSWDAYMMHAAMTIVFAASAFTFREKSHNIELMTCSLPVTRTAIVIARYLTSIIITIAVVIIWLGFAYLGDLLLSNHVTHFNQIFNYKVLSIILFMITIHTIIFLPAVFCFRIAGTIFTFIIAFITAVATTASYFKTYAETFIPHFETDQLFQCVVVVTLLFFFTIISMLLALRF